MRRLRVTFSKGEEVRYISHLDLMRTWERILRRAGVRPAHSQGFNPRPRLVFAAPLPVGVTSDAEILDAYLEGDPSPEQFLALVRPALPPGIELRGVTELPLEAAPLMATVHSSDYLVELETSCALPDRVAAFMASEHVPYERSRKGAVKQADMRPAVLALWVASAGFLPALGMRLRLDIEGQAVRPEEVVRALDPEARILRVHRTALQLKDQPRSSGARQTTAEDSAFGTEDCDAA
jgi:radical SAM-linked protein